jgi:hypothetical protein
MSVLTFIWRFSYFSLIAIVAFIGVLSTILNTLQSLNGLLCVYSVETSGQSYSSPSFKGLFSLDGLNSSQNSDIPSLCSVHGVPFPSGCELIEGNVVCDSNGFTEKQSIYDMRIVCDCNDVHTASDGVYFSLVYSRTFISLYTESRDFNEPTVSCKVDTKVRHCSLNRQFYTWFVSLSVISIILLALLGVLLKYNPMDSFSMSSPNLKMAGFAKQWLCDSGLVSFCSWIENKPMILSDDEYFIISPRASVSAEQIMELGYEALSPSMSSNKVGYSYSIWREGDWSCFRLDFKNEKGFHRVNCGMREHLMLSFCVLKISEGVPISRKGEKHIPSFKELVNLIIKEDNVLTSSMSKKNDCFYGENIESLTDLVGKKFHGVDRQKIKELVIHNVLFFHRFDFELILKGIFCMIKKPESCKNSEWKMYLSDVQNHILEGKSSYKKIIKKHQGSKALTNLNDREEEAESMTSEIQGKSWLKAVLISNEDADDSEKAEEVKGKSKDKGKGKNNNSGESRKSIKDIPIDNKEYKVPINSVEMNCIITDKLAFMRPEWDDLLEENKRESKVLVTDEDRVINSMERSKCVCMSPSLDFKEGDKDYDSDGSAPEFNPSEIPNVSLRCDNDSCMLGRKCPKYRVYGLILNKLKELKENGSLLENMTLRVGYCNNILSKKVKKNVIIKELRKTALIESGMVKKMERIEGFGPIGEMNAFNRLGLKRVMRNNLQFHIPKNVSKSEKEKEKEKTMIKTDEEIKHNISGIVSFFRKEIERFGKTKPLTLFGSDPEMGRNKLMSLSFKAKAVKLMEIAMENHKEALSSFMDGAFGKGFSVNKKVFTELETGVRYSFKNIGVRKYVRTKIFRSKKKMVEKFTLAERLNMVKRESPVVMTRSEREKEAEERIRRSKTPRSCINKLNISFSDMQKICSITKTLEPIKMKDLLNEVNRIIDERNAGLEELIEKCKGIEERIRCFLA